MILVLSSLFENQLSKAAIISGTPGLGGATVSIESDKDGLTELTLFAESFS